MKKKNYLLVGFLLLLTAVGCKKKDSDAPAPSYTVPTYSIPNNYRSFENTDYSEVSIRLNMFKSIENYIKKAVPASGTYALDSTLLDNMLANVSNPFTDSTQWNSLTVQIKDHINPAYQADVVKVLNTYAKSSASTVTASEGVAGLMASSASPSKRTLFDPIGVNNAQTLQKELFGTFLVYQINHAMLTMASYNNTTKVAGKNYTAMEHAWDEAFGYLGFPGQYSVDSLTNTAFIAANKANYFYIANYASQVDAGGASQFISKLVTAFIKGRAAISNNDPVTREAQSVIITQQLERFLAACVVQEINELLANGGSKYTDPASKLSSLSESRGFLLAVRSNNYKTTISNAQVDDLLKHYHNDLYQVTIDDANYVKNTISAIYGFDSIKDKL